MATTGKVACLLCQRHFKTEEVLQKHIVQSDLHKARLFLWKHLELAKLSWVQGTAELLLTSVLQTLTIVSLRHASVPPKTFDRRVKTTCCLLPLE